MFGPSFAEVDLDTKSPKSTDVDQLAQLAESHSLEMEVRNSASSWVAARLLQHHLVSISITYLKQNWCLSESRFIELIQTDWMKIADTILPGRVEVGSSEFELIAISDTAPLILKPTDTQPERDSSAYQVWDGLWSLANAAAWRDIGIAEERIGEVLKLSLHGDHSAVVELSPSKAFGGLELWQWLHETRDGNREEALRYVLRFLTGNSDRLPNGESVRSLAERQRIALSREHAAEVQRAISEGQDRTMTALQNTQEQFSRLVEDTAKTVSATVVAAVGVVALIARSSDALPDCLLVLAGTVTSIVIVAVVMSRWTRINDLSKNVETLQYSLESDPLLPNADRDKYLSSVKKFEIDGRACRSKRMICILALLSLTVIVAATLWLLIVSDSSTSKSDSEPAKPVETSFRGE